VKGATDVVYHLKPFSFPHLFGLIIPLFIGVWFIITGIKSKSEKNKKLLNVLFVVLLIMIRGSRYVMDIIVGRFDIYDILSLQICHIDLILLIICLIKPNKALLHFIFLIGIPMGLAVALFPGSIHPAPGLPRAVLFIMSHMLLVTGAIYLAAVEKIVIRFKYTLSILGIGNILIIVMYFINKALGTNFLYIMYAPEGTVIAKLNNIFGWPGYVAAMDAIAITVIMLVFLIYKVFARISNIQVINTGKMKAE
jgi:hypothetical integral membrane protein (TIGR02206 family)